MRTLAKNKQKMYYALLKGEEPEYVYDENGEKIIDYIDEDGNIYYRETGNKVPTYFEPVLFYNEISGKLSEELMKSFGVDDSSIYAQMVYMSNQYPFKAGTLIWKNSEIKYKDKEKNIPEPTSADYIVVGVLDEFPNVWSCLLKRTLN